MERCWLPGLVGMLLFAVEVWKHAGWRAAEIKRDDASASSLFNTFPES